MIRVIGVKVKGFVLNGWFDRLYGTKSPVNGCRKLIDIKMFGIQENDKYHILVWRLPLTKGRAAKILSSSIFNG
jgi:hypothetical protein